MTLGGGDMHFPVVLLLAGDFGARNVSALCQDTSEYEIVSLLSLWDIGIGKHEATSHLPSSIQFSGGMNWLQSLLTRGYPLFNFQETKSFVNSMTLKIVSTDTSKYLNPPTDPTVVLVWAQAHNYVIIRVCIGLCTDVDFRGNACSV